MARREIERTATAIANALADAIHEHRLAPGSKLSEDEVGEIFGVSRTVVRAALQSLGHSRLVELKRNHGAFVAQPTTREAREVFEARMLLEPATARAAAERMTEGELLHLRRHLVAEHAAVEAGDPGRALHLSGRFHVEVARIADQETVAELIAQLVARSSLVISLYWQRREALCENDAHHRLVEALARQDGAQAEAEMRAHLASLMAALDLGNRASVPTSLREALG